MELFITIVCLVALAIVVYSSTEWLVQSIRKTSLKERCALVKAAKTSKEKGFLTAKLFGALVLELVVIIAMCVGLVFVVMGLYRKYVG